MAFTDLIQSATVVFLLRLPLEFYIHQVARDSYHNVVTEETVSGDSFRFMKALLDKGSSPLEAYEAMVKADREALEEAAIRVGELMDEGKTVKEAHEVTIPEGTTIRLVR